MRYVIVTDVPFAITEDGLYAVEERWGWDLQAQLKFFKNICVLAPQDQYDSDKFQYTFPEDSIDFSPLPKFHNIFTYLFKLPEATLLINRYIKKYDIIHSVGSPFPPHGIIANLLCWSKGYKRRIVVLDSDTVGNLELMKRFSDRFDRKLFYTLLIFIYFNIFKFCISNSPLTFVVGNDLFERYKMSGNVHKIFASWVKEEDIIPTADLEEKARHLKAKKKIKLCYAARLIPSKGPHIAIDTVKILRNRGVPITLEMYGTGSMKGALNDCIRDYDLCDTISLKGEVLYSSFYEILRQYDAILIPNLGGEQPRIIFDAFANGVIVFGSDIKSFNDIITDGDNGILCTPNDPNSFAERIESLYRNRDLVEKLILSGAKAVGENTIESMHKKRRYLIDNYLDGV